MHLRKGWPAHQLSQGEYAAEFADPAVEFAWETLYHRNGRLIGVGLVDVLPDGLSSVYFYHAPDWRPSGPGTFSVLREIEWARELGLPYLYLGYFIERCPSMAYKNRFNPHELLAGGVEPGGRPVWQLVKPRAEAARPD
jgi:arginine-tRNA-protein transferase